MPLKNVPFVISPELLKVLCEMGHGDEIGHGIPVLLEAILKLFPLDGYVNSPVSVMALVPQDVGRLNPTIWQTYKQIVNDAEGKQVLFEEVERFAFYERSKKAYAVVHTGETAQYGNIILKKGIVFQS